MNKLKLIELRKRAVAMRGSGGADFTNSSDYELRAALQALQIHQIELESQNEELCRVQEELMEIRDQYVDLYDFAPVGYLTLNDNNLIVKANLTVAALLGEKRKSLIGQPFSRFIFPCHEDQAIFSHHFSELVDSTNQHECELRMRSKDGAWLWAKLTSVHKAKSAKGGVSIRIALHDITDRKCLEAEVVKAKKLEATALLAGGIAHDFNNLLAVILGNLEMVHEDVQLLSPPVDKKIRDARDACLAAGKLTKKFLTFSSGGDPHIELTHVESLLEDSATQNLAGSNVHFACSFPDNLWPVEVDVGQITLAIGNVLINSREAMPHGGMISISAVNVDQFPENNQEFPGKQAAKYVKVAIHDQGVGIPEEVLPQIFDPYFSSKEMGQEKGIGLGLSVAYSILKKHGGMIEIASKPKAGTTVYVYLPAADRQIDWSGSESGKAVASNKKILVMDDEEMLRNVTRDVLEMLGYEVEVACDGEEAIKIYSEAQRADTPFGAVILDLTIKGGMGGQETIQRLQEIDPAVRAIVASGYAHDPVMANFKKYGFLDALHKPYQLHDIERSLGA